MNFETMHGQVQEVCPYTGEYIELKEIPKRLVVRHYLQYQAVKNNPLAHLRVKMEKHGLGALNETEIERAYKKIKKFAKKRYDH